MKNKQLSGWMAFAVGLAALTGFGAALELEVPLCRTVKWDMTEQALGHHRVALRVPEEVAGRGVLAVIPWRRSDREPQNKALILQDAAGKQVKNLLVRSLDQEKAEIVFEPVPGIREYYLYYLPFPIPKHWFSAPGSYLPFTADFDPAWAAEGQWLTLPSEQIARAEVVALEAVDDFHRFDPMELCATGGETEALRRECPGDRNFMIFPESRERSIRMKRDLPVDWVTRGEQTVFSGNCRPGENFAFQLGLWAARGGVADVKVSWGDLTRADGAVIPGAALQCLNSGGVDHHGVPFESRIDIAESEVRPLWFFLTLPEEAAGRYEGAVTIDTADGGSAVVAVVLEVSGTVLASGGVENPELMTRLGWFNSTIGVEPQVLAPYQPLRYDGDRVELLNRTVTLGEDALPVSLTSNGIELLKGRALFEVQTEAGTAVFSGWKLFWDEQTESGASFHSTGESPAGSLTVRGRLEYEGFLNYTVDFLPKEACQIKDITLALPIDAAAVPYAMGFGRKGAKRPEAIHWKWNESKASNALWLGGVSAGLQLRLNPAFDRFDPSGTLFDCGLPEGWYNDGAGGAEMKSVEDTVLIHAFSGARQLAAGQRVEFGFRLLLTPFKPVDWAQHWQTRRGGWAGIPGNNVRNLFHGVRGNKYINYPFCDTDEMRRIIDCLRRNQYNNDCAVDGKLNPAEVELYYTMREVSARAWELWAMRALREEIFAPSAFVYSIFSAQRITAAGGGYPYLMEHLQDGYVPGWLQPLDSNTIDGPLNQVDASIATKGYSRLANYYIESVAWLMRNFDIRGIYLDGLAFDRVVMRRLAQVMAEERADYLIQLHAMDNFDWSHTETGNLNLHMEHLPFLSDLWLGEMYDYSAAPDYWLTEISGLPFGLTGEQLNGSGAGNFFRGMLYGMNWRKEGGPETTGIWKLWDDFGIQDAAMYGYWEPETPVRTDQPEVKVTTYKNPKTNRALVVLAHWGTEADKVIRLPRLETPPEIDGKLTDEAWSKAARMVQFYRFNTAVAADDGLVFYLAFDAERLYFGFDCPKNADPVSQARSRDGMLWEDDSADIFIAPDYQEKPVANIHWIGNADGAIYDAFQSDAGWNGNWAYRTSRDAGGWRGEGAVPLADLGITVEMLEAGTVGINFGQTRHMEANAKVSSYTKTHGRYDTAYAPLWGGSDATREEPRQDSILEVRLELDAGLLGLDPAHIHAYRPELPGIQSAGEVDIAAPIRLEPNQGSFLILEER